MTINMALDTETAHIGVPTFGIISIIYSLVNVRRAQFQSARRYGSSMLIRSLVTSLLLMSATAFAEIEKFAIPGEKGMAFHWWPKLAPVAGWTQDKDFSFKYSINALAPIGASFADSETVMYAKAIYKPRVPDLKSLAALIENDKKDFVMNVPGVMIQEAKALVTADGKSAVSLIYAPRSKGNWERVSYFEEGDFYLIFTVSSRTENGFLATIKAYEKLLSQYKEKP
jgi:hypothetical protein